jgi:hypothetical protein
MVRRPIEVYLYKWDESGGRDRNEPKLNEEFQQRIQRVYNQDAKVFDRFVTSNPTSDPIYKSSPTFLVTTISDPPIPGGLADTLDNLTSILFRPSPSHPRLPTLKELRKVHIGSSRSGYLYSQ